MIFLMTSYLFQIIKKTKLLLILSVHRLIAALQSARIVAFYWSTSRIRWNLLNNLWRMTKLTFFHFIPSDMNMFQLRLIDFLKIDYFLSKIFILEISLQILKSNISVICYFYYCLARKAMNVNEHDRLSYIACWHILK